MSYTPRIVD